MLPITVPITEHDKAAKFLAITPINVDGSTVNLLATAKAIATATSQLIIMRVLPFNFLFSLLAVAY
jgi:hypothetical protein